MPPKKKKLMKKKRRNPEKGLEGGESETDYATDIECEGGSAEKVMPFASTVDHKSSLLSPLRSRWSKLSFKKWFAELQEPNYDTLTTGIGIT